MTNAALGYGVTGPVGMAPHLKPSAKRTLPDLLPGQVYCLEWGAYWPGMGGASGTEKVTTDVAEAEGWAAKPQVNDNGRTAIFSVRVKEVG